MLFNKIVVTSIFLLGLTFIVKYTKRKYNSKDSINKIDKTTSVSDLITSRSNTSGSQTMVSLDKNENYFIKETVITPNNKWYDIVS
tara:strand:+ start:15211 stop:15468 length:258 start_codon:yes stop_codon:yes gene_type:complete